MNKLILEGMEFYARHGYYEEEKKIGNKYTVDVTLDLNFDLSTKTDKLQGTVNYEKVYAVVSNVMSEKANLLEYLAGKIIDELKVKFPQVNKITVKVSKHNPPINGLCKKASVIVTA